MSSIDPPARFTSSTIEDQEQDAPGALDDDEQVDTLVDVRDSTGRLVGHVVLPGRRIRERRG